MCDITEMGIRPCLDPLGRGLLKLRKPKKARTGAFTMQTNSLAYQAHSGKSSMLKNLAWVAP